MLDEWGGKQLIPVKKNTKRISQKVWEFSGSFCFVNPCLAERSQNPSWKHSVSPCTRSLSCCLLGPWSLVLLPCNPVLYYSGDRLQVPPEGESEALGPPTLNDCRKIFISRRNFSLGSFAIENSEILTASRSSQTASLFRLFDSFFPPSESINLPDTIILF